jgi:hypothetical protein
MPDHEACEFTNSRRIARPAAETDRAVFELLQPAALAAIFCLITSTNSCTAPALF